MISSPPAGKALIGLIGIGTDWRMLMVVPALKGGYYVTAASSDRDAGVSRWTGPNIPVEPHEIAFVIASISDADWSSPAVEWHAIDCGADRDVLDRSQFQ